MDLFKAVIIGYDLFEPEKMHIRNADNKLIGYVNKKNGMWAAENIRAVNTTYWNDSEAAINELLRQDEQSKSQLSKIVNNQTSLF
jgi:ferritin